MIFPDKVYNILKWVTQIVLPAIGTLYFALSGIWGLPYGEAVVGTITAIVTCLGVVLGVSSSKYNKVNGSTDGSILVESIDDIAGNSYIQFDKELDEIKDKNKVTLDVLTIDSIDGKDI